jgi:hypothetical protein
MTVSSDEAMSRSSLSVEGASFDPAGWDSWRTRAGAGATQPALAFGSSASRKLCFLWIFRANYGFTAFAKAGLKTAPEGKMAPKVSKLWLQVARKLWLK